MSDTAEDFIRREVGRFLRVDYRGKFMCASCLLKLTLERFGTTRYTRGQIERTLDTVFRSPGALRRVHAFVCDQCGKTLPCLTATPSRPDTALPPMDEQNLRTRIRALMASGALPTDTHASVASIEMQYRALPDERCVVCQEAAPHILYTFREGKLVRLHAACDAFWREERLSS